MGKRMTVVAVSICFLTDGSSLSSSLDTQSRGTDFKLIPVFPEKQHPESGHDTSVCVRPCYY